ncbi:cadherin-23-like [Physella acuta]|uniref:cadherin-23-like n=1 Tax=Physella acuta TaxID=109671 RepID=UPI0027DCCF56|nr:cadherin-23-like [Physella acuta]
MVQDMLCLYSKVLNMSCTDADSTDTLTYSVSTPFYFPASPNQNKMELQSVVDYDSGTTSYDVDVTVSDGTHTQTVKVHVQLLPVNEFTPAFPATPLSVSVAEGTVSNPITTYTATDSDASPHNIVSYSIVSVTNSGTSLFAVDSATGKINLKSALDYESLPTGDKQYVLVIVATDGGGLAGTGTVTVVVTDANDKAPVCTQYTYSFNINEGIASQTLINNLGCTDEDTQTPVYTLNQAPSTQFSLASGKLTLDTALDYESVTSHTLTITVEDHGTPVKTSTVSVFITVVNINDGGPTFSAVSTVTVNETVAIGSLIIAVTATDPDGTDPIFGDPQYSIIGGDTNQQFTIDVSNGRITTRKLLDYELIQSYSLTIQAKERGGANSATVTVSVQLNDINDEKPTCSPNPFLITVMENKPAGFSVQTFACSDRDASTILTYSLTTGDSTLFKMNSNTLELKSKLDFSAAQSYNLVITASDSVASHDLQITGTIIVGSVNDGPPVFQNVPYQVSTSEATSLSTVILQVTAIDPDPNTDLYGQVKYSFQLTYPQFFIDQDNGKISVVEQLDRETTALYTLVVIASDGGTSSSGTSTVIVTVTDSNDNTPKFSQSTYSVSLPETITTGTTVQTVSATDADDPATDYGKFSFALSGSSKFTIDSTTGVITNNVDLTADSGTTKYTLLVTATDNKGLAGALTGSAVVIVTVTAVNQYDPTFASSTVTQVVNENQYAIGDVIVLLTATDADIGQDGQVTLTFVSPQTKFYLTQNGNVAEVRLSQNLDFDQGDTSFVFYVKATDSGSPARSATCTVTITVNDVNDNAPLCTSTMVVHVTEGQTNIATLNCQDDDAGTTLAYQHISTTPSTISPTVSAGLVTVSTALDYETGTQYTILIKVSDNGSPVKSTTVTIILYVTDLNDNDPTINGPFTFTVAENQVASSSVLYTVDAKSNDGPTDVLTYLLSDTTYFQVSSSGEISLKTNAPDYETVGATYNMIIYVKDSANPTVRTASQTLTVTVTDVNDMWPVFNPRTYSASPAESVSTGTAVTPVTATDGDTTAAYHTITYTITSGNTGAVWSIDNTGAVKTTAALDYETVTSYNLVIQASDGSHSVTANYVISVTPVNEYDPVFSPASDTKSINENVDLGTTLATVSATDSDKGNDGVVVYSIDTGPFTIDSSTGVITVSGDLNRELHTSYTLTVQAVDKGTPSKSGSLILTVNINDVNDNKPYCSASLYSTSILESSTSGTSVATLVCHDDDLDPANLNNALTYTIISGSSLFVVDSAGAITVKSGATFDRETSASETIIVHVIDKSTLSKLTFTATVLVTILDVNDNAPTFTSLTSASVPENSAIGTTVQTVVATDQDSGVNKELVYDITSGNTGNKFYIDPVNGYVVLQDKLDYETTNLYTLVITVKDKGTPSLSVTGTLTVSVTDVNDKPPVCASSLYTSTIAENSISTSVTTVSCTDTETVGTVSYSITSGDTNSYFTIDTAGVVSTSASANIDYETTRSYVLVITASDGIQSAITRVQVTVTDVNEADPQFSPAGPYTVTMSESSSIGDSVKTLATTDADTYDSIRVFSITAGNSAAKFMIDASSGLIKLQGLLDHETTSSYSLTLKVEDSGGRSSTTTLTVSVGDVNDNSPVCSDQTAAVSVNEGVSSGILYTPTCSDLDTVATPTLLYSMSTSDSSISIDTSTGKLSLSSAMDYETQTVHDIVIIVSDQGSPAKTTTISVRVNVQPVNEFPPVFTSSATYGPYSIAEDTALGTSIGKVSATDSDMGLKQGTVIYSIVAGDTQQQFAVDESTGVIEVVSSLDREAKATYTLTLRAKDDESGSGNEKSADATVYLTITDVNDNSPLFNPSVYTINVLESAPFSPAAVLKTLTVHDDDAGTNAATTITIISGNSENKFSISGNDVTLVDQLDYETTTSYELIVQVADGGSPSLKSTGRVLINVLPANDQAPLMTTADAVKNIPEDTSVGTLVFKAVATDLDAGVDGIITYSIASGVTNNEFVIDASSGEVFVGSQLDYDTTPNTYAMVIRATDGAGASAATSTVSLSIVLTDINDHVPQFSLTMFIFSIKENVASGTSVGKVVATDKDSGVNGAISFTKLGGSGLTYFNIDSSTGVVSTAATIDYEAFKVFFLSVTATDGGSPSFTSTGLVKILVENMNDNKPSIVPADFAVILSENSLVGASVLSYYASDIDTAIGSFSLATANSYFQVNSANGDVTTKATLDRETLSSHVIYIQVIDQSTSSDPIIQTSTATLTIIVDDINDNPPVITGTYSVSVLENSVINTLVLTVTATDLDANQNGQLTYSITAGNTGSAFKIDSTGRVQVAAALDRETTATYTITIRVSDKGTPSLSDQIDAVITITDVNDNDPVFSLAAYTFNVNENSNTGTAVGTVTATDADSGVNGALTYSFDTFTLGTSSHFAISGSTGAITVTTAALDRETMSTYSISVKVVDSGTPLSRTSYTVVTVYIDDLNDNAPIFTKTSYSGSVNENSATSTSILKVSATDADINTNAAITYSINTVLLDGANANTYLQISSSTGVITPKTSIDYETIQKITCVVVATDGGTPSLTGTTTVTITILDTNDNSPVFSPTFYNTEVAYSGDCESTITTVTATDADSGNNGLISYSLQTSLYNYLFTVNSSTGKVSLSSIAEADTTYSLDIQASDAGNPIKTATSPAKVRVDSYVPNNHVVTFRLKISRESFLAQLSTFLTNLQTVVRNTYPTALVRLTCVQEYDGVAQLPPSGRRRLLATQPVDAFLYVVKDDTTNNLSNINTEKQFLTQDEFLSLVAANPEGDPGTSIQGTAWNNYRIESVNPYYQASASWWDTDYGKIITAIACLLGLCLLGLLIYFIARCCCYGRFRPAKKNNRKHRIMEIEPVKEPPKRPFEAFGFESKRAPDDFGGQPYRAAFPPMLISDPAPADDFKPRLTTSHHTVSIRSSKTPRSLLITTNEELSPPNVVNYRDFDGRAMDHVTGKMYEYNTKTNERRWIK